MVGPPGRSMLRVNPISAVAPGLLRKFFEFPNAAMTERDARIDRGQDPSRNQTGFSSTWRLRPSDSLITPSGVRSRGVSASFSSVTAASLTRRPPPLI